MSLLLDDMPLVISPRLAQLIGLNEAIVLQQIHYWLSDKKQSTGKVINGAKWIYNSITSWEKQFPFMSYRTIQRTLKNLKDAGLLLTGVFNKDKRDKTLWYTIDYKAFNSVAKADHARCQKGISEHANMADTEHANMVSPLPENTTEITTDIYSRDKSLVVDDEPIDQPEDDFEEEIKPNPVQPKKTTKQAIPYQKIVELYEQILSELPVVNILNDTRKSHIRARWNEHPQHQSLEFWKEFFEYVKSSDFLMGKIHPRDGGKPFRANIDWLLKPVNFAKVTEGNYV